MRPERLITMTGTLPERIVMSLREVTSGFTLWRADVLRETVLGRTTSAGYSFQAKAKRLALRAGHAAIEVPVRFKQRRTGLHDEPGRAGGIGPGAPATAIPQAVVRAGDRPARHPELACYLPAGRCGPG